LHSCFLENVVATVGEVHNRERSTKYNNTVFKLSLLGELKGVECPGGYSSGQRGQTVNLLTYVFTGSNPVPPTLD
jgi:hypothetical protein